MQKLTVKSIKTESPENLAKIAKAIFYAQETSRESLSETRGTIYTKAFGRVIAREKDGGFLNSLLVGQTHNGLYSEYKNPDQEESSDICLEQNMWDRNRQHRNPLYWAHGVRLLAESFKTAGETMNYSVPTGFGTTFLKATIASLKSYDGLRADYHDGSWPVVKLDVSGQELTVTAIPGGPIPCDF
jgi:hypothetical protein